MDITSLISYFFFFLGLMTLSPAILMLVSDLLMLTYVQCRSALVNGEAWARETAAGAHKMYRERARRWIGRGRVVMSS
ncbi:uncharacterized protein VTP21DRAFT_3169 [Calcarisporiella thermophila]|uniref:uncharacterized protein n=1 Tax=Calcarisporiella thermophila TaxID=911321 RepID=UPI0037430E40